MYTLKAQKRGGATNALLSKRKAEEKYLKNPTHCKNCGKVIPLRPGVKVSVIRHKKFCCSTCSAIYNNSRRTKKLYSVNYSHSPTTKCKCGNLIQLRRRTKNTYYNRTKCDACLKKKKSFDKYPLPKIGNISKGELFRKMKSWQSARSQIVRHAIVIYQRSNRPLECVICGYKKYVQISHRKSVSSFSEDTLIKEINDINNLIPLCPTNHWEFDHNCLDDPEKIEEFIKKYSGIA